MTERRSGQRKDRLIQTRVPQDLENTLKDEARKRRLSVSHLIRNVLEDTFNLVDNVVVEVDRVMADSRHMAQTLRRDAERIRATAMGSAERAAAAREAGPDSEAPDSAAPESQPPDGEAADPAPSAARPPSTEPPPSAAPPPASEPPGSQQDDDPLGHIYAWQPVVLNRVGQCARCARRIDKGEEGHIGLTDRPGPRAWLCHACVEQL